MAKRWLETQTDADGVIGSQNIGSTEYVEILKTFFFYVWLIIRDLLELFFFCFLLVELIITWAVHCATNLVLPSAEK